MTRGTRSATVILFLLVAVLGAYTANLAGVTMPDNITLNGHNLVLNGLGLRTKFMVKVYVGGLYLEQKSSDANAIIKSPGPKRIVLQFLRGVSKGQLSDSFTEAFSNNSPDAINTMKPDIDRFLGALDPVRPGEQVVITTMPGTGTTLNIDGHDKVTISNPAFAPVLLAVWLGSTPPTPELKNGMLGR